MINQTKLTRLTFLADPTSTPSCSDEATVTSVGICGGHNPIDEFVLDPRGDTLATLCTLPSYRQLMNEEIHPVAFSYVI